MEILDAKAIRTLLSVVRIGSIRGAAEHMNVAPSVVSRQIAETERNVGLPLFERTARGVRLTEAGALVLEHGNRVLEDGASLEEQIDQLKGVQQGKIRILCGEGFLNDLIQHALCSYARIYPLMRYIIHPGSTEQILDSVANGDADIGVAYNPLLDVRIKSTALTRQPLCVIAPSNHPILSRSRVKLVDCLNEPMALLGKTSGVTQLVGRVAADAGMALAPILETSSIEALRRFVEVGMGITFLPRFAVAAELPRNALGAVELEDPVLSQASAHVMIRARRRLPKSVDSLTGHLALHMVAFR